LTMATAIAPLGEVKEGDDDLYEGFNVPAFKQPMEYNNFQNAGGQSAPMQAASILRAEKRMGTARMGTARMGTARQGTARVGTARQGMPGQEEARPMTSIRAAGYTSHGKPGTSSGLNQFQGQHAGTGPAPPLEKKESNSPEDMARETEKKVNALLEESATANSENKYSLALEKAKEGAKKERQLCKHREQHQLMDQMNIDLTYAVCFNLANQYQANEMYMEALNTYSLIVKNKQYPQSGRLRVNMGNIYFKQKKFPSAIKMYRMALDQIGSSGKELRFKIMRNIGNAFVRMGNYQDAIMSYEAIMEGRPDLQSGFNLVVCYFALGDKDRMKKGFAKLLSIREPGMDISPEEEEAGNETDDEEENEDDELKRVQKEKKSQAKHLIVQAAKLIAPKIEKTFVEGFDFVIETLRATDNYMDIASDMEISKAVYFLKHKKPKEAKETLLAFEKKDQKQHDSTTMSRAYTNVCFIYFLEGDMKNADHYGTLAIKCDRYNAKALVNKGNCEMKKGQIAEDKERWDDARDQYNNAKELYMEGIGVEAECVEAIFNLGLCCRTMARLEHRLDNIHDYENHLRAAGQAFEKLFTILPDLTECNYNIATIYDELDLLAPQEGRDSSIRKAEEWYKRLIAQVKSDSGVLARFGALMARVDEESQAVAYHLDSYRYYPVDMDVISWLGAYQVKSEMYEEAIKYFEKAAQIQPKEVKWQLMVASCHRRVGSYTQALDTYKDIDRKFPHNIECLQYLVRLCKELGKKDEKEEYQKKLSAAEAELGRQQASTRGGQDMNGHNDNDFQQLPVPVQHVQHSGGGYGGYGEFQAQPKEQPKPARIDTDSEAARAVAERQQEGKRQFNKGRKNSDDWGDDELGDDLLPGM